MQVEVEQTEPALDRDGARAPRVPAVTVRVAPVAVARPVEVVAPVVAPAVGVVNQVQAAGAAVSVDSGQASTQAAVAPEAAAGTE